MGLVPDVGKSPEGGHGNPLQYSYLENPMGGGVWGLQSMGSQNAGDTTEATEHAHRHQDQNEGFLYGLAGSM